MSIDGSSASASSHQRRHLSTKSLLLKLRFPLNHDAWAKKLHDALKLQSEKDLVRFEESELMQCVDELEGSDTDVEEVRQWLKCQFHQQLVSQLISVCQLQLPQEPQEAKRRLQKAATLLRRLFSSSCELEQINSTRSILLQVLQESRWNLLTVIELYAAADLPMTDAECQTQELGDTWHQPSESPTKSMSDIIEPAAAGSTCSSSTGSNCDSIGASASVAGRGGEIKGFRTLEVIAESPNRVEKVSGPDGQPLFAKWLSVGDECSEEALASKLENLQSLCCLQHSSVVQFKEVKQQEAATVLVLTELIEGSTLNKLLEDRDNRPLEEDKIRHYSTQICGALQHLHLHCGAQPIVHRDICGDSVMIDARSDCAKLIGFGLAVRLASVAGGDPATAHYSRGGRGSLHFLAPEICDCVDESRYSPQSDVWAFGCVVHLMATGRIPHNDCKGLMTLSRRIKSQGAPRLSEAAQCSEKLLDFYACCTAAKPQNRLPASQLLQHRFLVQHQDGDGGLIDRLRKLLGKN